ncbi:MAG: GNAT family N-acetyltransferase [Actinocrinis sp.]
MTIDVRKVREEEFDAWSDAIDVGFHMPKNRGNGEVRRKHMDRDRCWGAFDGDRPVGTFRGIGFEITVPGGAAVRLDGISSVTVAPTHRRRGLLSRMMAAELGAAKERGEALSGLYAAEYPIYGRFGFGPAVESAAWYLDARAAQWIRELPGTVELVEDDQALELGPRIYDEVRALTPGAVSRARTYWERFLGMYTREGDKPPRDHLNAVCYAQDGKPVGFVRYTVAEDHWTNGRPDNTAKVADLFAVNVDYEARLWKYLADHDWVSKVAASDDRRPDELWRELLVDRRAAWSDGLWEGQWIRVLDPVAALSARRYEVPGRIVLRVADKDGYADGTFALEGGPDGATCGPTAESPDVTLPATVLASIYLGGISAARYAALGLLDEHRDGSAMRLASMFHTAIAPWAPTSY